MSTKRVSSEAAVLEQYRVSLENALAQPDVKAELAEVGYTTEKLEEGNLLYQATRKAFDNNKAEVDETTVASLAFQEAKEKLDDEYTKLRKRAKVVFLESPDVQQKLMVDKALSNAYTPWIEGVTKFYNTLSEEPTLLQKLARLKVTAEQIASGVAQIAVVQKARAEFLREQGESQVSTQTKDAAFELLDKWMSEFYAVARIAFEDHPQLLEVLGKMVKN